MCTSHNWHIGDWLSGDIIVTFCLHCLPNQAFSAYTGIYGVQHQGICAHTPLTLSLCLGQSLCVHAIRFVCLFAFVCVSLRMCMFVCTCLRMHLCVPWRPGSAKSSVQILQALFRGMRLCFGVLAQAFLFGQLCSQRRRVTLQPNLTSVRT